MVSNTVAIIGTSTQTGSRRRLLDVVAAKGDFVELVMMRLAPGDFQDFLSGSFTDIQPTFFVCGGMGFSPLPKIGTSSGLEELHYRPGGSDWIRAEEPSRENAISAIPWGNFTDEATVLSKSRKYDTDNVLAKLQVIDSKLAEHFRKLLELEPGWDGYGGEPPTQEAVKTAAILVLITHGLTHGCLKNPSIGPLPDGGFDLEWELESGAELMLVVPPSGEDIRYVLDEPTDSGVIVGSEGTLPTNATLTSLIRRLVH